MEIASKFPTTGSSSHRGNHAVAHHEGANVPAVRFGDVFLDEDGLPGHQQSLDEVTDFVGGVAEKHAVSLRSLGDFHHDRQPADHRNRLVNVRHVTHVSGAGNRKSVTSKDL